MPASALTVRTARQGTEALGICAVALTRPDESSLLHQAFEEGDRWISSCRSTGGHRARSAAFDLNL